MAELFIEAFINVLFEKLASGELTRLVRSAEVYSKLTKWTETLTQIQAKLVDARQRHIHEPPVQLWLNKLQHVAYEIDDVLDDLTTEATRHRLYQESHATTSVSKVLKFFPTKFDAFKYGRKMSSKLDEITAKLDDLDKEKKLLGLNDKVDRPVRGSRRLEETSLVDESKIIGREGDKETLLGGESSSTEKVSVVSVVGMGGIGKTTLARLLYNDERVKSHFGLKGWVCVSDDFDVFTISKAIFKDVGGDDRKFETLNQLQVALTEILSNKRFLIVLDDVWNENYNGWESLQRPFNAGAPGSIILVTTRKTKVASVMDSVEAYPLEFLSDEEALSLFSQHASGKQNFDVNRLLTLYGEDIVKKCGKLPLALRTIGRVFRTKASESEWEELLNSEIWNLDVGNDTLPALSLSYYDLPPHLKQIFAYCCLFPKDYNFEKDELVLLWMAEGFLNPSNKNMSLERFGRECFEELESRSFFQHSTTDESLYTMHDLINDLAKSVAGEFFFMLDDKVGVSGRHAALEKLRHLSFIRETYEKYERFEALQRARGLRTFLGVTVPRLLFWDNFHLSNKVLTELLPQLKFLRVLSLANSYITEIPQSICTLKHMRYLNFSYSGITCLPEQIGDLLNLQSLLLFGCWKLSSLPNSIVKLINLRHLGVSGTSNMNKLPQGIGGLTSLQTLSKVIIGGANDDFSISNLKGLSHLEGQLCIKGLHNVKNAGDAKEANLQQKKGIYDLQMEWSDDFDESRNATTEYEVLESLMPSKKLKSLTIVYYMGREFPSWVGDSSFVWLKELTLRGCKSCTCLPTLGQLSSLQKLFVKSMHAMTRLGSEFLGPCNGVAFRSLEHLEFNDMDGWEEWTIGGDDKDGAFSRLREISIINCPKLDVVAIELIPSLEVLHVEGCSLAVLRSMIGVSSSIAKLTLTNINGLTRLNGEVLEHLQAVERLKISRCDEVKYLWDSEAEAYEILGSLQKLEVKYCANLVSLGEKEVHSKIISTESVTEVEISGCPRLESYNCPNNIEKLEIWDCPSIVSLTFPTMDDVPSTLVKLTIGRCDNVEPSSWLLDNLLSSLESLSIWNIPNLRLFPEGRLVHLTRLYISRCDNIEFIPDDGYGFLPFFCLRYLDIIYGKNLKSFPNVHLQSLISLEEMHISYCPSLDDSFPCGLWPPNLRSLAIGGLKKPISEWGVQNFPTSLVELSLFGENSGVVSFATKAEEKDITSSSSSSFILPSSLTYLSVSSFMELESVSEGMQHLTCLQHLSVIDCPKLRDLPEMLLPSLSSLLVSECSKLIKKCSSKRGKYWPIISQIPDLRLNLEHRDNC